MLVLAIQSPVVDLNTCRRLDTHSRTLVVVDVAFVAVPPVGHLNRFLLLKIVYWLIVLARNYQGLWKKILLKQLVEDVEIARKYHGLLKKIL